MKFIDTIGFRRDDDEIAALKYRMESTDIYSCSYGTIDNRGFPNTQIRHIEDVLAEGVSRVKCTEFLKPKQNPFKKTVSIKPKEKNL